MPLPKVGDPAPSLRGPTDEGSFDLADHNGKFVVVYFYPKDSTPGCTTEACDFRDHHADLATAGAVVVGVSRDSTKRHASFRAKHQLDFPLIADVDGSVTDAWGTFAEKMNYGRTYMGIVRSTFIIGRDGKIAAAWPSVKVKGHAARVLEKLRSLG